MKKIVLLVGLFFVNNIFCYKFYVVNKSKHNIVAQLYVLGQKRPFNVPQLIKPQEYGFYETTILCGDKLDLTFNLPDNKTKKEIFAIPGDRACHSYHFITVNSDSYDQATDDTGNIGYESYIIDVKSLARNIEQNMKEAPKKEYSRKEN